MGSSASYDEYADLPCLTGHAGSRMGSRRISRDDVAVVLSYGRTCHVRGAVIYALGRQEAACCREDGLRPDRLEGLQVVCARESGAVLTVYRNHDFRSLRRRNVRWTPAS
jgi:hypothetical protein